LLTGEKRPLPWVKNGFDLTAVRSLGRLYLKRILLAYFADRNLSRYISRISLHQKHITLIHCHLLSPHCKHDVLIGVSKGFNRKQFLSLLSSILDNLDDGKIKKMSDE